MRWLIQDIAKYVEWILSGPACSQIIDTGSVSPYPEPDSFGMMIFLLKFFGGIILMFGIGNIIGRYLKLNRHIK